MRGNKRDQLMRAKRKALEQKRSAESKVRKEKRKAKGKAERIAKAIEDSPAGKKSAETLKEKRGTARKKEQANYQKTRARAATRMGGRRKQIQAELHAKLEE
jgi:phage terminase large subunit-like protein